MNRQDRITRFEERLRRCYGSGMRLWWDRRRSRWVVQERGRRTGAWQYVIESSGEDGSFREPGEWLLARLHSADMTVVQAGVRGAQKLRLMRDGARRRRMMQRAVNEAERFGQEILPRVMRALSAAGYPVPPSKIDAEERVEHLRKYMKLSDEKLDVIRGAESSHLVRAKTVIPAAYISDPPKNRRQRRREAAKRSRPC